MSKGVGSVVITYIRKMAKENNVRLFAEIIPNDRNRMMYITLKFSHFIEKDRCGSLTILENDLSSIPDFPDYMTVNLKT